LYCCQAASGAGHIKRALAMAEEFSDQFEVTMLLTHPAPATVKAPDNVKLVFLAALDAKQKSDKTKLSQSVEEQHQISARRETLLQIYDELRPRVVAVESFPFKQHRMRKEILPLIQMARTGRFGESLVVCITDGILANIPPNNEAHTDEAADILDKFFDVAIVRSDPVFARLEEFFRPKNMLQTPVYHIGFVVRQQSRLYFETAKKRNGILVSAGDGTRGMALYTSAIKAHRLLQQTLPMPMTIITGGRIAENDWHSLQSLANGLPALSLIRTSPNSAAQMATARWSISQCDYDTAVDAVLTRTPSLFVPSADMNHRQQIERAKRLVYWGAGRLLMPRHLNTASLVNEIHQLTTFEAREMNFDLNGAANAAQLIAQIVFHKNYTPVSTRPSSDTRLN
jgi:predicted glycosyltransferase